MPFIAGRHALILSFAILCFANPSSRAQTGTAEVQRDPSLLYNPRQSVQLLEFGGVKLHDPESKVKSKKGVKINKAFKAGEHEAVLSLDPFDYKISAGKVVGIRISRFTPRAKALIKSLKLASKADIEKRFGKPEVTDETNDALHSYTFRDGQVTVKRAKTEQVPTFIVTLHPSAAVSTGSGGSVPV